MKIKLIAFVILLSFVTGCLKEQPELPDKVSKQNDLVMATLYNYYAQEYRALAYQAFNLGKLKIDEAVRTNKTKNKLAVVVDIDETMLDNSPYQAHTIKTGTGYPTCWNEWCNLAEAREVPGASDFMNYAVSNGVDVFYVSNRKKKYVSASTVENLKKLGFPQAEEEHLLLREEKSESNPHPSDKESRRQKIREMGYEIILLVGDNLGDFYTDSQVNDLRTAQVEEQQHLFGSKFIVLPNAMYGNWPSSIGAVDHDGIDSLISVMANSLEKTCPAK